MVWLFAATARQAKEISSVLFIGFSILLLGKLKGLHHRLLANRWSNVTTFFKIQIFSKSPHPPIGG
jgi:hypothetical protein